MPLSMSLQFDLLQRYTDTGIRSDAFRSLVLLDQGICGPFQRQGIQELRSTHKTMIKQRTWCMVLADVLSGGLAEMCRVLVGCAARCCAALVVCTCSWRCCRARLNQSKQRSCLVPATAHAQKRNERTQVRSDQCLTGHHNTSANSGSPSPCA